MDLASNIIWGMFAIIFVFLIHLAFDLTDILMFLLVIPFFMLLHGIMKYRNDRIEEMLDTFYTIETVNGVITNSNFIPLVVTRASGNKGGARLYQTTEVYNFITLRLSDDSEIDIIVSRNAGNFASLDRLQYDDRRYSTGHRVSIDVRKHNEYFYCKDELFYVINNYRDLKLKIKRNFTNT